MNLNEEVICGFRVTEDHKRINAVYLDLLGEFDRLCRQSGLTYWVFFGGMIGAVRHKGFIPWDDDIDLLMPRRDFDRLQRMTSEEFGAREPYFLQNATTQPERETIVLRLRRSDTTNIRSEDWENIRKNGGTTENLGISLSVLPLDNYPRFEFVFKLQRLLFDISFDVLRNYHSDEKSLRHALARCLVGIPGERNFGIRRQVYRWSRKNRSGKVHCFHTFYKSPTLYEAEDFRDTVYLPFEDTQVPVPAGYDRAARATYGNYMEFPPEESRIYKHGGIVRWDVPYTETVRQLLAGELTFPEDSP